MPVTLDPRTTSVPSYLDGLLKKTNGETPKRRSLSGIGNSAKVSGIEVRMLPPLIKANGRNPFIGKDLAKLYCLTIVVSDLANQTVGGIDLKGFPRIRDNEHLPINKTIFYWQGMKDDEPGPNQIHFISRVILCRQNLRDIGQIMTEAKNDDEYKGLVKNLGSLLKKASALTPISEGIFMLSSIIGKYLGKVEDKDVGTVINSYTTLHGDFDKHGVNPYSYPTSDVDFNFELVVRDATDQQKALESGGNKGLRGTKKTKETEEAVLVDLIPL